MNQEQAQQQFSELYDKYQKLQDLQLHRSALKLELEAKRLAKTHRMLMPYIHACFSITNTAQSLYETQIGIDNAMEIIALVESEDKARKFQHDFDQDFYQYTVHWVSACAYDNLAVHTARRNGYNSPLVHGAVDDGIHVCRRTGKLECVECFREYAVEICVASGDYEMGEHYARLCAISTARENADDRRFIGYRDMVVLAMLQGKFQAAFEALELTFPSAQLYHDPVFAKLNLFFLVERLRLLSGREEQFEQYVQDHVDLQDRLELPSQEENPSLYLDVAVNSALKKVRENRFLEAAEELGAMEKYLLARENLNDWFAIRTQRIASLLLAKENGIATEINVEELIADLKKRANKACQWSAIRSVDAMSEKTVPLNPLGIPFPIDLGPYASEGTPLSRCEMNLMLPLVEKPSDSVTTTPEPVKEPEEKTPLELEVDSWLAILEPLWGEAAEHDERQYENGDENTEPFPKAEELLQHERDVYEKIMRFSPEAGAREGEEPLEIGDFATLSRPLSRMRLLRDSELLTKSWKWLEVFARKFPEEGRAFSVLAFNGMMFRNMAAMLEVEPESLALPNTEQVQRFAAKGFELSSDRSGAATTAGLVFRTYDNPREAQRYFTRACQLDRLNEYATISLAELYEEAERPKDAMATVDLYTRAGGRHPGLLWKALQIAFSNEMPHQFLLYFGAFTESAGAFPMLQAQYVWALAQTENYRDAITALDTLDGMLEGPAKDRLFARALFLAELEEEQWTEVFQAAFALEETPEDGLLGTALEPCEPLWKFVAQRYSSDDPLRLDYERFLLQRSLAPQNYFSPEEVEDANEDDYPLLGFYRCIIRQPLESATAAYAGWVRIPPEMTEYFATWLVLAEEESEAMRLALEMQSRCYPLPPVPEECEQLDSYYASQSHIAIQGRRFSREE